MIKDPSCDQLYKIRMKLKKVEQEKKSFQDIFENSKNVAKEARQELEIVETKMSEMVDKIQESEKCREEAEQKLAQVGYNLGVDNYMKEELTKCRKENNRLTEKVSEMERKVLRSERVEKSETMNQQEHDRPQHRESGAHAYSSPQWERRSHC